MIITLMRHGHAESFAASDAERALTSTGIAQVQSVAGLLKDQIDTFDQIWVSPFKRAQQTWEIASESLTGKVIQQALITPHGDVETVIRELSTQPNSEKILLVTHQMLVGDLLDTLCGFESARYIMGTANVAVLSAEVVAKGLANLDHFLVPEM